MAHRVAFFSVLALSLVLEAQAQPSVQPRLAEVLPSLIVEVGELAVAVGMLVALDRLGEPVKIAV